MKIDAEEVARRAVVVYELRSRIWAADCELGEDEGPPCTVKIRDGDLLTEDACDSCRLKIHLRMERVAAQAALTRAARSWRRQCVPGGDPPEPWEVDR